MKGRRTAQTIKSEGEIQLHMPECKPRFKSARACNTDQQCYFGGLITRHVTS